MRMKGYKNDRIMRGLLRIITEMIERTTDNPLLLLLLILLLLILILLLLILLLIRTTTTNTNHARTIENNN